jgi:ABC-type transport system involved in multi-copper enzyme maturation permease subunit
MMTLLIARLTLQEAVRRKLVWAVLALSLLFIALYVYGFHLVVDDVEAFSEQRDGRPEDFLPRDVQMSIIVMLGLWTVNFLAGVMTIFAAVGAISSEIEAGTLHVIVTKPLARFEIIAGKYLGFLTMVVIYISLMFASVIATARLVGDYTPPNMLTGLGLMILVSTILLSLTMLGSTIFSTMANGVIVFMLYGLALTGGLVEQIGTSLNNDTMVRIGVASSVLVPSDSMWKLASYKVQPSIAVSLTGPNPFGAFVPPSDFAVRHALVYCLAIVLASMLVFQRRDL